ncbi:hypothetical protein [Paludisphaera sp.]|uniref:hypothetical protein n=1 Tax=Paludisphaera sp. TaxID=2017432 RepID=UPI00301DC105
MPDLPATLAPLALSPPASDPAPPDDIPRTRSGRPKRRFTLDEKLRLLDPDSPPEATKTRLVDLMNLYAFRRTGGVVTRVGQGPRAWTALRGKLYAEHVVRHLLGARVPTVPPQWVGTRSFDTSCYAGLDVDADRTREQVLADKYDLTRVDERDRARLLDRIRPPRPKPPFGERRRQVETAIRRLGLDPDDPRQVVRHPTPSGGRWYDLFFDRPYFLHQYRMLFEAAGLRHVPGQVEFFPSATHARRLPFGHIPGRPHDPGAWVQFIDDYANGRIRRHSLQDLYDNLDRHRERQSRRILNVREARARDAPVPVPTPTPTPAARGDVPSRPTRRQRHAPAPHPPSEDAVERYRRLVDRGPGSAREAEELMALGIRLPGTRTAALKHLAAHLVWFRGHDAEEAAGILAAWALDPRHESEDVARDLARGTDRVARHVDRMCRWYADHRDHPAATPPGGPKPPGVAVPSDAAGARPRFAPEELLALRPGVLALPPADRPAKAHFLLHFLAFAKRRGRPAEDGSGWDAAPAIRQVVRRWPGCHHMNYKARIDDAKSDGVLQVVKDRWHNPNGPGRARTYRLAVPVVPEGSWSLDYDSALAALVGEARLDPPGIYDGPSTTRPKPENPLPATRSHEHERDRNADLAHAVDRAGYGADPAPVRPQSPGADLEPGPRERDQEPDAALALPGPADGPVRALPPAVHAPALVPGPGEGLEVIMPARERAQSSGPWAARLGNLRRFVEEVLAQPSLRPEIRRLLETPSEELSESDLSRRVRILCRENERRRTDRLRAAPNGGLGFMPDLGLMLDVERSLHLLASGDPPGD